MKGLAMVIGAVLAVIIGVVFISLGNERVLTEVLAVLFCDLTVCAVIWAMAEHGDVSS